MLKSITFKDLEFSQLFCPSCPSCEDTIKLQQSHNGPDLVCPACEKYFASYSAHDMAFGIYGATYDLHGRHWPLGITCSRCCNNGERLLIGPDYEMLFNPFEMGLFIWDDNSKRYICPCGGIMGWFGDIVSGPASTARLPDCPECREYSLTSVVPCFTSDDGRVVYAKPYAICGVCNRIRQPFNYVTLGFVLGMRRAFSAECEACGNCFVGAPFTEGGQFAGVTSVVRKGYSLKDRFIEDSEEKGQYLCYCNGRLVVEYEYSYTPTEDKEEDRLRKLLPPDIFDESINSKKRYRKYLRTPLWKYKKKKAYKHYGTTCLMCGDRAALVHHRAYPRRPKKRWGDETLHYLTVLCDRCHKLHHDNFGPGGRSM